MPSSGPVVTRSGRGVRVACARPLGRGSGGGSVDTEADWLCSKEASQGKWGQPPVQCTLFPWEDPTVQAHHCSGAGVVACHPRGGHPSASDSFNDCSKRSGSATQRSSSARSSGGGGPLEGPHGGRQGTVPQGNMLRWSCGSSGAT